MKYLRSLVPPSPVISAVTSLTEIRARMIQFILYAAATLGAVAVFVNVPLAFSRGKWFLAIGYLVAWIWVLTITFYQHIPYVVKSLSIIIILYFLSISGLLAYGLSGNGRVIMVVAVLLTAILLGNRAGYVAIGFGFIVLAVTGLGMTHGWLPLPSLPLQANSNNASDWINAIVILLTLVAFALLSLLVLVNNLNQSLERQSDFAQTLENQSAELERTVGKRTLDLQYRLNQLRTASEITRLISANLDPQTVIDQMATLLLERFDLYYVGIFLIDELGKNAVLKAATGEAGKNMLAQKHKLAIGGASMIGSAISNRKARIALDVGQEAIRFNNPFLPLTRSEMALPLIGRDQVIGAMTLQSSKVEAFDEDDIVVLQGIADILATAYENADLFQNAEASLAEVSTLHQSYLEQAWTETSQSSGKLSYTYESSSFSESTPGVDKVKVPLTLRDQVIGYITIETGEEGLAPDEMILVDALAAQTAQALENARLLEATQRQVGRERMLNQMSSSFTSAFEVDDILRMAAQELGKLPNVAEVSVLLNPPEVNDAPISTAGEERNN
jgi:GAF domain-containing protein